MSASRCLRCAFEAARPAKRLSIRPKPVIQTRKYADVTDASTPQASGSKLKSTDPLPSVHTEEIEDLRSPAKRPPPAAVDAGAIVSAAQAARSPIKSKPIPPNVAAAFRTPYRHPYEHGMPVASLQLRSFSVRNLDFFADFALRVAYYLKLSASGPVPLPKRIERWTVPKSNFVHKKSQENFERITLKRLITIYDGQPEVIEIWLACLRKWQYYGVGMKANVWQHESLDVAQQMDKQLSEIEKELDKKLENFGWVKSAAEKSHNQIPDMLLRQGQRNAGSPLTEVRASIKNAKGIDYIQDERRQVKS